MSLKTQLLVTFGLLLVIVIAMIGGFTYNTSQLERYQELTQMAMRQHAELQAAEISLSRGLRVLKEYVLHESAENAARVEAEYAQLDTMLRKLLTIQEQEVEDLENEEEIDDEEEVGEVYEEALADLSERRAEFHKILDLRREGNVFAAAQQLRSFEDPKFETNLLHAIHKGVQAENQEVATRTDHMARWRSLAHKIGYVSIGLIMACVMGSLGLLLSSLNKLQKVEIEREALHKELVRTAHSAGMSEIATGVLHNVGNVLNSINTSAACMAATLKDSVTVPLGQILGLAGQQTDLAKFIRDDPRGQMLSAYFAQAATAISREREELLEESRRLDEKMGHIKSVIRIQQDYARGGIFEEVVTGPELMQDAIMLCDRSLHRHDIQLVQRVQPTEPLLLAKSKLLQVLVNLIKNAKESIIEADSRERVITVVADLEDDHLRMSIADTGMGIAPETLDRLFNHGFSTKADGKGFGLHSCAIAIQDLGGSISVQSDGPGTGATFMIRVPVKLAAMEEAEALAV